MPTLFQSLPANDLGFLRIAAALWGLELESSDPVGARQELAESLCDAELLEEVVSALPEDSQNALGALVDAGGRLPWAVFTRRFGEVREMGAGKRDREKPHARPISAAETLWYRALLARAFFETDKGPQEFAYLPDDLLEALGFIGFTLPSGEALGAEEIPESSPPPEEPEDRSAPPAENPPALAGPQATEARSAEVSVGPARSQTAEARSAEILGRPASPGEKAHPLPPFHRLLDDLTTLLAALRVGRQPPALSVPLAVLNAFLQAAGLLEEEQPQPERIKAFLEQPRPAARASLLQAWRGSDSFNDLRLLPDLRFEGGWSNDPLAARHFVLPLLQALPPGQWWSLAAFVRDFKTRYADFQRPAPGDFDSWFIKNLSQGAYLRGFEHWDEVEGALLRFYVTGPLYWLGCVEVACADLAGAPSAFRWLAPVETEPENGKISLTSRGKILLAPFSPRATRYQISRFCEWQEENNGAYTYHISAASLQRAAAQGLKVGQLLSLLAKHTAGQLPPAFVRMLQRWEQNGVETRIETLTVLRVKRPETLEELRSSKAGRFLGERIGPTVVKIPAEAIEQVQAALAELGLLAEVVG